MEPTRHAWLAPPLIALAVIAGIAAIPVPPIGAATGTWQPPPCGDDAVDRGDAVAWFTREERLTARGTVAGYRVELGLVGTDERRALELPAESFVGGPWGARVLVGADDGRTSALRLVDVARACATEIGSSADVVRSALLGPGGAALVEHRVDRQTRADLGVWQRPLDGSAARRLLDGLPPDEAHGPTWATRLAFGEDGTLAVASCGERRCRVRTLHAGRTRLVTDVGIVVAADRERLVAQRPCAAACPLEVVELATGARRIVLDHVDAAVSVGDVVLVDTGARLLRFDPATGDLGRLADLPAGLALLADGPWAGVGHRADRAVAAPPDGSRLAVDARLIDPATGAVAPLSEVLP